MATGSTLKLIGGSIATWIKRSLKHPIGVQHDRQLERKEGRASGKMLFALLLLIYIHTRCCGTAGINSQYLAAIVYEPVIVAAAAII